MPVSGNDLHVYEVRCADVVLAVSGDFPLKRQLTVTRPVALKNAIAGPQMAIAPKLQPLRGFNTRLLRRRGDHVGIEGVMTPLHLVTRLRGEARRVREGRKDVANRVSHRFVP